MTPGRERIEKPADGRAQSKCIQVVFHEDAKRPAEESHFSENSVRGSWRKRALKHQENEDV